MLKCGDERALPLFSFVITEFCNYDCSYCNLRKSNKIVRNKISEKTLLLVISKLKNIKFKFNLEILGGEPTYNENLEYIIQECSKIKNIQDLCIITNMSKNEEYFKKFEKYKNIYFIASYHFENTSLKEFTEKILSISKYVKIYPSYNIPIDKSLWLDIKNSIQEIRKSNIHYFFNILIKKNDEPETYDISIEEFFKEEIKFSHSYKFDGLEDFVILNNVKFNSSEIMLKKLNSFKNIRCKPLFFDIDYKGDITNVCSGKKFFINIILDIITCKKDFCSCYLMSQYPKYYP